jgi:hypothetical protein
MSFQTPSYVVKAADGTLTRVQNPDHKGLSKLEEHPTCDAYVLTQVGPRNEIVSKLMKRSIHGDILLVQK